MEKDTSVSGFSATTIKRELIMKDEQDKKESLLTPHLNATTQGFVKMTVAMFQASRISPNMFSSITSKNSFLPMKPVPKTMTRPINHLLEATQGMSIRIIPPPLTLMGSKIKLVSAQWEKDHTTLAYIT